ncbi:MAG: phytanoyl-CoA dioxygenase family protein [Myxococcota bacterium]
MTVHRFYEFDPHAMNVPWLESPFASQLLEQAALPGEAGRLCREFAEKGYVVFDSGLPEEVFDTIREQLAGRYRPDGAPTQSCSGRIQDAWSIDDSRLRDALFSVACGDHVLDLFRVLYRREPVPFQTLNFPKGTEQKTHSDTLHFHSLPHRFMCGVWIAFEDIDTTSGPLHYYPGSHKLPIFDLHDLGLYSTNPIYETEDKWPLMRQYERFIQALTHAQKLERTEFCARKGQVLIWSANLLHGGCPILDPDRSRHSMVTHYFFEDCVYYTPFNSDPALGRYSL